MDFGMLSTEGAKLRRGSDVAGRSWGWGGMGKGVIEKIICLYAGEAAEDVFFHVGAVESEFGDEVFH